MNDSNQETLEETRHEGGCACGAWRFTASASRGCPATAGGNIRKTGPDERAGLLDRFMNTPFFTIGHSTRPLPEFTGLLRESEIEILVDIRSIPKSRTNPQFNLDAFPASLSAEGFGYVHIAALGGRRGKRNTDEPSPNTYWTHPAFRNYADYALGEPFREGFDQLLDIGIIAEQIGRAHV